MRPFLPQSKVNFPVLLKLVVIYGVVALIVLLCVAVVDFALTGKELYSLMYQLFGWKWVLEDLSRDFGGIDSEFIQKIRQLPFLTVILPFGAGGIFGVLHYIFVRRRRSNIPH